MYNGPNLDAMSDDAPVAAQGGYGKLVVILSLVATAAIGGWWYNGRAVRVAAADRAAGVKPVLMMFTADWCGPCQNFKNTVLADDRVFGRLYHSCRFEKVDLTRWEGQPADDARRFGVSSIPTLILVNSKGQEIDRYDGPHHPEHFARWLDRYTR